MNSTLLQWDLFLFVFWRKSMTPKKHFEINWPLKGNVRRAILLFTSKNFTRIVLWNRKSNVQDALKKLLNLVWILIWIRNTNWKTSINFWNEVIFQMPRGLSKSLQTPLKTLLLREKCQKAPGSNIFTMIPFLHWENRRILVITTPKSGSRRNSTSNKNEQTSSSKSIQCTYGLYYLFNDKSWNNKILTRNNFVSTLNT